MKHKLKSIIINILTWQAKQVLSRHKPKVVAITGSLGKTGTKDAVAAALSAKYTVRKSPKTFNTEFGVPLTILGLPNGWYNPLRWFITIIHGFFIALFGKNYEEVLVLEVGADKPGDIASLAKWIKADVVVITAVPEVPVHVEFYPTAEAVLKEKSELIKALKRGGLLITGNDAFVGTLEGSNREVVRVDYNKAEVTYSEDAPDGMYFTIGDHHINMHGVLGYHQGLAPAFALAVAKELSVNIDDAIQALESMERTPGRMRILSSKQGATIIDDSYNSSPLALASALETLGSLEVSGRKIAVLSDMLELGEYSDSEHRRAGVRAAQVVDELYVSGNQVDILVESAIESGLPERAIHVYDKSVMPNVAPDILKTLQVGDVVLIKGSQSCRLEKITKCLMLEEDNAVELLVRQDKDWLRKKSTYWDVL